jgi:hypothetical protein
MMVDSDIFIGGFSTNVARVAYEVMVAQKGCFPPFVSVDIPWCHNNGMSMGKDFLPEKVKDVWAGASC